MKTTYFLLGLMALSIYGYGQSIELTFSGQEAVNHNPVYIDSVLVTNLTKGCDTTLYGNNPVLALFPTGIEDLDLYLDTESQIMRIKG